MKYVTTIFKAMHAKLATLVKFSTTLAALSIVSPAYALVIDGSIYHTGGLAVGTSFPWLDTPSGIVETDVGLHYFNVTSPGIVTIDVLSWENATTDVNGDGEIAFFDTTIRLYQVGTNALMGWNDDSGDTFGDGSIWDRDAYLSLTLAAGNYFLAVGSWDFSDHDALIGPAGGSGPITWNGQEYVVADHGDYRLTVTGDVSFVPEPGSALLLALGLIGLGTVRRRRSGA